MPKSALFIAILTVCTISCASQQAPLAALEPARSIGLVILCDSGCKPEWERAQVWLVNHSALKIQLATDVLLQTYNPGEYATSYGFTIVKEPDRNGWYAISARLSCRNLLFGCHPREEDVRQALLYYVKTGTDLLAGIDPGNGIH